MTHTTTNNFENEARKFCEIAFPISLFEWAKKCVEVVWGLESMIVN